jgi:tetratricopeptide (TPR) repeat protein
MDEGIFKFLKYVAIVLVLGWIGWTVFDSFFLERIPGNTAYQEGDIFFQDGEYEEALRKYEIALEAQPDAPHYVRAKARTLMQLGRNDEALQWFNQAVELRPFFGGTYANRGILLDRMGEYEKAVADYEKAIQLDETVAEGPHWLIRFLRNQPEPPPTVADRLAYLKQEMAKPESERVLRVPEEDEKQRTYKK